MDNYVRYVLSHLRGQLLREQLRGERTQMDRILESKPGRELFELMQQLDRDQDPARPTPEAS